MTEEYLGREVVLRGRYKHGGESVEIPLNDLVLKDENGGSLPDGSVTGPLALIPEPEEGATSAPTLAEIDSSYNVFNEWSAERDYSLPFAFNADQVIVLLPPGSANVFMAEINGASTGTDEPDWDVEAPNVGDDVTDGSVTWYNTGPQSAWPPAPVTFEADEEYAAGTLLWPSTPNGHLYLVYPPGPFVAAAEPDPWSIKGNYTSGDSGYALDLGTKLTDEWAGGEVSTLGVPGPGVLALARLFIQIRDRVGYVPGIAVETSENGYVFLAVNNETFIVNNPDADNPPLLAQLVEGGGVLIQHQSETPGNILPAYHFSISTDNALRLSGDQGLFFDGLPTSPAGLPSGQVYVDGVTLKVAP